jgi:hypothetical protein
MYSRSFSSAAMRPGVSVELPASLRIVGTAGVIGEGLQRAA